jgi:ferredoxin-NADP reductase
MLYRVSRENDAVFRRELADIAQHRGAGLQLLTGRRALLGYDPLSAECLAATVPDLRAHDVYVCGPDGMTRSVVNALRRAGVPRRQIHSESFEF